MIPAAPLLEVDGLSRRFGGVHAVDGVSFSVGPAEVLGLIGPNGAGKTTVVNLLSGFLRPDAGVVRLSGEEVTGQPPHRLAVRGLARTYQHIRLFPALTALENVLVGEHARRRAPLLRRLLMLPEAAREDAAARERAGALLDELGLRQSAGVPAGALPYGDRRRLEIARALASRPRLLLLDEPAAGMGRAEVDRLIALIRGLPARGHAVLLIEHNMRAVMTACDRIAVLNFGRLIAAGTPAAIRANPLVIEAYLGQEDESA